MTPREIVDALVPSYGLPSWRPHHDPMTELVLTILSQNTSDTNSGRAFMRLITRFPTWEQLRAAPIEEIEAEIAVGGLARQKAPRIKAALDAIYEERGDFDLSFLGELGVDEARRWLMALNGVGPKTAACVLVFAFGLPAIPVDTHVHRVAQRLGLIPPKLSPEKAHAALEAMVDPELVYALHVLLIKHGRRTCLALRPRCGECPLLSGCPYGQGLLKPRKASRGSRPRSSARPPGG
jgi:endonuclease-3